MTNVNIVDSVMGSGKTSWAIQHMNEAEGDTNFIYITPFLSEVRRVCKDVPNRKFIEPIHKGKGKLENLKKMILNEADIATTHSLFQCFDDEIIQLLKTGKYTLILDEVMNVVEQYDLNKDDLQLLIQNKMILVDKVTGLITWNSQGDFQDTEYNKIKNLAKTENLYFFENTILFWTFPVSAFQSFKEIYIMTYLFKAQQQKYYFDMYNLEYSYQAVQKLDDKRYVLLNHTDRKPIDKTLMKAQIKIYEGKLNNVGDGKFNFSVSWFGNEENRHLIEKLKNNLYSYFKNNVKTPSEVNMWTCYKTDIPKLVGNGYRGIKHKPGTPHSKKECHVVHNARAMNEFNHKETLAYAVNRFMNPYEKKFFLSKGITVDEDMYALSELIQWIWRSRIREGKAINLYIPSKRMRTLLKDYLDNDL